MNFRIFYQIDEEKNVLEIFTKKDKNGDTQKKDIEFETIENGEI